MPKKGLFLFVVGIIIFCLHRETYAMRLGAFEVHPFLGLSERFTDNVFNTATDEKSDFSTVITPGIELIYPRAPKRYHLELLYRIDIERFYKFTSENTVNYEAKGKFDYKLPSGFEFNISDRFLRTHDPRGVNISPELDFYKDNLFSASVAYELTDRFKLRLDYSNYNLNYEAERNAFRNRTDNTFGAYVYYRIKPKTSVFIEYEYVILNFKESDDFNSREHHFYAGVTWDVTGKTKGTVKGGYEIKNFEDPFISEYKGYIVEANIDHNFDSRRNLKVTGTRRANETNVSGSNFFVATSLLAEYFQKITGKITAKVAIGYERDRYEGGNSRKDDTWRIGPGFIYEIKKWLRTEAEYGYTKRKSTVDENNYGNNTFIIRVITTL